MCSPRRRSWTYDVAGIEVVIERAGAWWWWRLPGCGNPRRRTGPYSSSAAAHAAAYAWVMTGLARPKPTED